MHSEVYEALTELVASGNECSPERRWICKCGSTALPTENVTESYGPLLHLKKANILASGTDYIC